MFVDKDYEQVMMNGMRSKDLLNDNYKNKDRSKLLFDVVCFCQTWSM